LFRFVSCRPDLAWPAHPFWSFVRYFLPVDRFIYLALSFLAVPFEGAVISCSNSVEGIWRFVLVHIWCNLAYSRRVPDLLVESRGVGFAKSFIQVYLATALPTCTYTVPLYSILLCLFTPGVYTIMRIGLADLGSPSRSCQVVLSRLFSRSCSCQVALTENGEENCVR